VKRDYEERKHSAYTEALAWFAHEKLMRVISFFLCADATSAQMMLRGNMPAHLMIPYWVSLSTLAFKLRNVAQQARPKEYHAVVVGGDSDRKQARRRAGSAVRVLTFARRPRPVELWARENAHYGKFVRRQEDRRLRRVNIELCALAAREFNSAATIGRWASRFVDLDAIG